MDQDQACGGWAGCLGGGGGVTVVTVVLLLGFLSFDDEMNPKLAEPFFRKLPQLFGSGEKKQVGRLGFPVFWLALVRRRCSASAPSYASRKSE